MNVTLYPLTDFGHTVNAIADHPTDYWYAGRCPKTGIWLQLPRTPLIKAIAHHFMAEFAQNSRYAQEGKMYGVLLVQRPSGEQSVLKAFSGLLNGQRHLDGWVPPIPGRDQAAFDEAYTLAQLQTMKQDLIALHQIPERHQYETVLHEYEIQLTAMAERHRDRKQQRQASRQELYASLDGIALTTALEQLEEESRRDGLERRHLKRQRDAVLQPLKTTIDETDAQIRALKQRRKDLSRSLQSHLYQTAHLTNFLGESVSLHQLMPEGMLPTGTGECCAPKLLHYAATHQLIPLAMAEFWWGPSASTGDKVQGEFYDACAERCQPLMGFLLSGISSFSTQVLKQSDLSLTILYEDEWFIAVDKPSGLLSVPGRYRDRQDSVMHRLHSRRDSHAHPWIAVHRLDQDTSGILLVARDPSTYRQLSQQFQTRQVHKVYEALLDGVPAIEQGIIELPLRGDMSDRPRQIVDWQQGKPSQTHFRVLAQENPHTRVEFIPQTGRTHQLRVHAADPRGLGIPIVGDRLYGSNTTGERLCLHARELHITHPHTGQPLHLHSETPF